MSEPTIYNEIALKIKGQQKEIERLRKENDGLKNSLENEIADNNLRLEEIEKLRKENYELKIENKDLQKEHKAIVKMHDDQNNLFLKQINEIQQLKKQLKLAEENEEYWHNAFSDLEDEYARLKDKINRAILYIQTGKTFENKEVEEVVNYLQNCLLDILKGENNE